MNYMIKGIQALKESVFLALLKSMFILREKNGALALIPINTALLQVRFPIAAVICWKSKKLLKVKFGMIQTALSK